MSTLIPPSGFLPIADATGKVYSDLTSAIDTAQAEAQGIVGLLSTAFADDIDQLQEWYPGVKAITRSTLSSVGASGQILASPLSTFGVTGGGFGVGQGLLNRASIFQNVLFPLLSRTYGPELKLYGPTQVVDIDSYATYENGLTAYSCLYSPSFASAYWYAYSQNAQLSPGNVFAPAGIVVASGAITAADTITLTAGALPTANGYTSPAPTVDDYGNNVYVGGMPMAQGFAPVVTIQASITSAINGTCALTVTAPSQLHPTGGTFTATLDSAEIGATVNLLPATSGDRMAGVPTAFVVAGSATAGAFELLTVEERSY